MRSVIRTCAAVVLAVSFSAGGTWSAVSSLQASPRQATVSQLRPSVSEFSQQDVLRAERVELAGRLVALEQVKRPSAALGHRVLARLKRVVALLETLDLQSSERQDRFAELGVSWWYSGRDLIVSVSGVERSAPALGAPVHALPLPRPDDAPDGAAVRSSHWSAHEWEQEWEDAQIDAEHTIVAIEALALEAEWWADELLAYPGTLQGTSASLGPIEDEQAMDDGCAGMGPAHIEPLSDPCIAAVMVGVSEALSAAAAILANSEAVQAALTNARNAVGVAMGLYTAGTLTAAGLAEAAVAAITALVGTKVVGWLAAGSIILATAAVVYVIWDECLATPTEALQGA